MHFSKIFKMAKPHWHDIEFVKLQIKKKKLKRNFLQRLMDRFFQWLDS